MTTVDYIGKLRALTPAVYAQDIIEGDATILVDLQKQQLWAGQDREGRDLAPTYLNDPYFKTPEQAKAYSAWKDKITPRASRTGVYPDRPQHVPNLYINGYWQSGIKLDLTGKGFIVNTNELSPAISEKYPLALGLNDTGARWYARQVFFGQFISQIKNNLL